MKKLVFITGFIIISLSAVTVNAQFAVSLAVPNEIVNMENIDNVQFVVQYQVKIISDTLKKEDVLDELMILKAGNKSSVFYNYNQFVADSMFNEQRKKMSEPVFLLWDSVLLASEWLRQGYIKIIRQEK